MRHKHYTYSIVNPHPAQPAALAGRMAIRAVKVEDFHSKRHNKFLFLMSLTIAFPNNSTRIITQTMRVEKHKYKLFMNF